MKGLLFLILGLLSLVSSYASDYFAVAIKAADGVPLSAHGGKWNLEIGEAFPWLGYVKQEGNQWVASEETTFSLLQVDNCTIIAPTSALSFVKASDSPQVAITYRHIVQEFRAALQREVAQQQPRRQVTFQRAVNDADFQRQMELAQAMEREATEADLNAIRTRQEMEKMTEELRRIRNQQFIQNGGRYSFD